MHFLRLPVIIIIAGKMISAIEPLTTTALIFGGCCTNVFALERIVK